MRTSPTDRSPTASGVPVGTVRSRTYYKKGITDVRFLIAADPEKFPNIEVTEEPPDGDPRPSGNVVLAST